MAVYREDLVAIELNSGSIHRSFLNHSIGSGDAAANRFGVRVMRNGENVDLTGVSCFGYFRNAEGTNIALTSEGTVSGNVAYVTLPQACYNVEGKFTLSIKLIGGGVTGTMRIVDGVVDNTNTGGAVAPTEDIPTYTEILAVYDQMLEAVEDYAETVEEQNEKISGLETETNKKIFDLKSAITEQTRNLIVGAMPGTAIQSNGTIQASGQSAYEMWVAPVVSGKTYTVTTDDPSGLVFGYFSQMPVVGSMAQTGRIVQTSKTFTASVTGFVAFRSSNEYGLAQIEEGSIPTSYIRPLSAVDVVEREETIKRLNYQFNTIGEGITPTKIANTPGFDVFADFNNVGNGLFKNNSIYRFSDFSSSDAIEHSPVTPFNGNLITYGDDSTSTLFVQIAITQTGVVFVRTFTTDWRRVVDYIQFDQLVSSLNLLSGLTDTITPERIATEAYALYGDMNNFGVEGCPSNSIVRYANFTEMGAVDHSPVSVFNGILMSFSPTSEYSEVFQIAADSYGMVATRYVRRGYEYTYPWRIVAKPVYDITNASDLFNLLQTITTGIIHLREFEYDLYTGLFENLILADNTTRHFIDGDIEIIGAGTILKLHVPKAVAEAHTNAANATSIIDIMGNAKITGVIFDCKNTRYCCHYEASTNTAAFYKKITFEDCEFHYTRELSGLNADCVGIGGSLGQHFTFRNCKFANDIKGGIYIHTRQWCIGSLNVENCLFDCEWYGINLSQYTGTTAPIPVYIVNSRTGLVLISTQSGGNASVQWKVTYINSRYTQQIAEGSTLLYEPTVFDITTN